MTTTNGPANTSWTRLHPLSPLLRFGRAAAALAVVVGPRAVAGAGDSHLTGLVPEVLLIAAAAVAGAVYWLVTRWRISGAELQIETGLIRRQSIRVPLARIQAVDIVRPLLGRFLGLAELQVVVAGSGRSQSRLAYLQEDEAQRVRAELLALAHGLQGDTPEPPERRLFEVGLGELVASVALGAPVVVAVLLAIGSAAAVVLTPIGFVVVLTTWPVLFAIGSVGVRRILVEYGFTVAEAPDGLRIRSGLLQTRAETIPIGRVQAVRWVEPLLWRPFGWCRLEVDVARQHGGRGSEPETAEMTRALLPVGTRDTASGLLHRVLPEAAVRPPHGAGPPRRAIWRAPLSYRMLAAWHDDRYVCARTGRVRPSLVIVPLEKVQSLRWVQGPLQRALRLASVHVDTAGRRWQAVARARDAGEADAMLVRLTDLSGRARRSVRRVS